MLVGGEREMGETNDAYIKYIYIETFRTAPFERTEERTKFSFELFCPGRLPFTTSEKFCVERVINLTIPVPFISWIAWM